MHNKHQIWVSLILKITIFFSKKALKQKSKIAARYSTWNSNSKLTLIICTIRHPLTFNAFDMTSKFDLCRKLFFFHKFFESSTGHFRTYCFWTVVFEKISCSPLFLFSCRKNMSNDIFKAKFNLLITYVTFISISLWPFLTLSNAHVVIGMIEHLAISPY